MIFKKTYIVALLFLFLTSNQLVAQNKDTDSSKVHSPKKAVLLSAILPSAGQAYNKKYWKMPIVYAGLGVSTFFIIDNNRLHHRYRDEYLARLNGGDTNPDLVLFSDDNLIEFQDTYRQWRDLSIIAFGAVYLLQIIDAAVDAHFFDWDQKINQDLSFRLQPSMDPYNNTLGLKLSLKL